MSHEVSTGDRIAEKLKAYARNKKLDVLQYLQKYAQERLCVRLWAHEEGSNLSLKGGAAYHFCPEFLDLNRPTADIDVHTYEVLAHDEIISLFRKVVDIEDGDGMTFEIGKTSILEHEHGEHHGVRIHIVAVLGKTRIPTYADVGIGGEPPVGMRDIRVKPMVEGQSTQTIRVQPFAYSAAEKLHSVVTRGLTNSRMKDYRDLLVLARRGFDEQEFRQAVQHTFRQRGTELPEGTPVGLSSLFAEMKAEDWNRHISKNKIAGMPDFATVVAELDAYYTPRLQRELAFNF